ncbi:MAG: MerR family transcriptional regulator [Lachnospiraceae bacterium]
MIPEVHRTSGGIRDYQEEDLRWLELALCMRKAGLPMEAMIEYLRLYQEGDETIPARLELLQNQMELLKKQKEQLEATMSHLSYKISRYEEAMKTGTLSWDDDRKCLLVDRIPEEQRPEWEKSFPQSNRFIRGIRPQAGSHLMRLRHLIFRKELRL